MKYALFLLLLITSFTSCKKYIDKKQEEAAIEVITKGQWKVTTYMKGTENKSTLFAPYTFQFQPNETVDALRNGAVEKTGTWKVLIADQSIVSNFAGASEPLSLLNGTFKVTNSTMTTVDASQTVSGELWTLHMDKQ